MKKRALCLLLMLMMVCTLLPMGVFAADLSIYQNAVKSAVDTGAVGLLKDLDGDGMEELFMVVKTDDGPVGHIYTVQNGERRELIQLTYTGPEITETNELADLEIVGNRVVTVKEVNTDAGYLEGTSTYWREGTMTFYQLTDGLLKETDVLHYKLQVEDGTDRYYIDTSTVMLNGKTISGDKMNELFEKVKNESLEPYPIEQVYNAAQGFFQDVAQDQYYAVPVGWAVDNGITKGTSNVDFSPASPCTRAQVVTFLWRAEGSPKATSTANPFSDVASSAYYYDAVLWAVEKGITSGTSATTFSPDAPCTRAQVVTFLWRYFGHLPMSGTNPFTDVKSGEYYRDAVLWALAKGVTQGETATTFGPDNTCTRGQIVTFLYRALKK